MADIFISYKSKERGAVKIAEALMREGFSVWWDTSLIAGQDFSRVIDAEISGAKVVMPIWSRQSVASSWVSAEAERGSRKLYPVRIDDVSPPLPFNQLHTIDLCAWSGDLDDPRWRRVVEDLRALVDGARPTQQLAHARSAGGRKIALAVLGALVLGVAGWTGWGFLPHRDKSGLEHAASVGDVTAAPAAVEVAEGAAPGGARPTAETDQNPTGPGVAQSDGEQAQAHGQADVRGDQVAIEICRASQCGVTSVRVGEIISLRVRSRVSGRLVLIDQNAAGEQTQIFPNGLSRSGTSLSVVAGETAELPAAEHGFAFEVTEPLGSSKLIALVLPRAALPDIVVENVRERGIRPIPEGRRDEINLARQNTAVVATGELDYRVTP